MSPSPEIHNVGFAQNGYPHRYERFDTPDADAVMEKIRLPSTGGGSVTIPHKSANPPPPSLELPRPRVVLCTLTHPPAACFPGSPCCLTWTF